MVSETKSEIIDATNSVLCEHGYAGLTMKKIADEASMTTAAIHYHFDTKEELLNAYLDDLIERFKAKLASEAIDPRERLTAFLDAVFTPSNPDADGFPVAIMELKSQAPFQELFRERFLDLDDVMHEVVAGIVADGIDEGHFEETDSEEVARLVTTMINGANARKVALGEPLGETRHVLENTLELHLGWQPGSEVLA
ncbi:TetR/AcrR family transcriptional regulator [Halorubellus sp. PRR65]|uniref:TetR/AcrR family transcriptional regulator n=1 Tax=Halorubellus sp. PRR65 TaxID=3098148 RepID=UPI002B25CFB4|nr:TetR/AcrR family transcriptional regulator [Halorubellus sp. PRR65]